MDTTAELASHQQRSALVHPTRSLALDLLRVFAALWVVLYHWSGQYWYAWLPNWVASFAAAGFLGVDVFFILSGAVIANTALGATWQGFAQSRFLRLVPVFVVATFLTVLVLPYVRPWFTPTAEDWLGMTGLNLWDGRTGPLIGAAWSLRYEGLFYALIAFGIIVTRGLTPQLLRIGVYIFMAVAMIGTLSQSTTLLKVTLYPYGPLFCLGILIVISRVGSTLRSTLPGILVAAGLTYGCLAERATLMGNAGPIKEMFWALVVLLGSSAVIMWSVFHKPRAAVKSRISRWVKSWSLMTYPLYLLHHDFGLAVIALLIVAGIREKVALSITALLVLMLCWLSVRFFEPWARRSIRRLFGWDASVQKRPSQTSPSK